MELCLCRCHVRRLRRTIKQATNLKIHQPHFTSEIRSYPSYFKDQTHKTHMSQSPVTAMLFALCSRLHDSLSLRNPSDPTWQEDRHTCLQGFPSIVQTIGGGKKPSSFSLPRSLTHWQCYLEKPYFPGCMCLRSTLAFIPQALTSTLQLLNRSRSQLLQQIAPVRSIQGSQGICHILIQRSSHVSSGLPWHRVGTHRAWEEFPLLFVATRSAINDARHL